MKKSQLKVRLDQEQQRKAKKWITLILLRELIEQDKI